MVCQLTYPLRLFRVQDDKKDQCIILYSFQASFMKLFASLNTYFGGKPEEPPLQGCEKMHKEFLLFGFYLVCHGE
jgi:hypothetical protein